MRADGAGAAPAPPRRGGAVIETLREALAGERAWLVGGALRDRLLGRPTPDLDVVVDGDVRRAARSLGRGAGGASFELSDQFGAWRVVARDRSWQVDITPLQGGSLEADLGARDLTVNAMAEPLAGGELVDPHGGARDLDRKRLRMVSADGVRRRSRCARCASRAWPPSSASRSTPRPPPPSAAHAPGLAGTAQERVFTELRRIVGADAAVRGLALMDELDLVGRRPARADGAARGRAEPLPPPRRARATRSRSCRPASTSSAIPAAALGDESLAGAGPRAAGRAAGRRAHPRRRPALRRAAARHRQAADPHRAAGRSHRLPAPRRAGRRDGARRAGAPARQRAAALPRGGPHAPSPAPGLPGPPDARSTATSSTATWSGRSRSRPTSRCSASPTGWPRAGARPTRPSPSTSSSRAWCWPRRSRAVPPGRSRRWCAATSWPRSWASRAARSWASCMSQIAEARFAGEVSTRDAGGGAR